MAVVEAAAAASGLGGAVATGQPVATAAGVSAGVSTVAGDSPRYMVCQTDVTLADSVTLEQTILMVLNSDLTMAATLSTVRLIDMQASSTTSAAMSFNASDMTLGMDIRSALQVITDSMVIDDEEPSVWVVNPKTGATWRYEDFNFTQFLRTKRFTYGVKPDGIYLLGGNDDDGDPIHASIDMGLQDFGTSREKRLHTAYIASDATGTMQLRVTDGSGNSYMYAVTPHRMDTARIKLGRGLKANFYDLQLFNVDGGAFEPASIELLYDVLRRRV